MDTPIENLLIEVSPRFVAASEKFGLPPTELAQFLCDDFVYNVPEVLTLVEYGPGVASVISGVLGLN